ncbi:hypothetical protein AgCh_031406 [Apium graveolens]
MDEMLGGREHWMPDMQDFKNCISTAVLGDIRYIEVVLKGWDSQWYGDPMSILCRKVKEVKMELKKLNNSHGNVSSNVAVAREALAEIQNALSLDPTNVNFNRAERKAIKDLEKIILEEEELLHKKSRVAWLHVGDNNSKFFFSQIKARWNRKKLLAIENTDGNVVFGHKVVAEVAVDLLTNYIGAPPTDQAICLEDINCNEITPNQASILTMEVTPDLIWKTIKSMKKNKAPSSDGFNVEFFISTWDIVGPTFCDVVIHLFKGGKIHPGINSTSIALVPKSLTPSGMKDFRPISLCSVAYKCIAKILADRMKFIMPNLIKEAQSAFIPGRSISDNILLAQELFRGYQRDTGTPKCALKIDLYKAFDSIRWDFILAALSKMKFPLEFIHWITECITTTRFSVKVNGGLSGYFKGAKGLRQGDPLSQYLLTIGLNVLSCMLSNTSREFNYHWKCKGMKLSHLFFADDVLLFSRGDKGSITHIMNYLDSVSTMSGLQPSIHKSTVFLCNCTTDVVDWFDLKFGNPHGSLPVKFLGVPLISSQLSINDYRPLIEKLLQRIDSWTTIFLSLAGRVQFIKTVLNAIPGFWTNHFMLPKSVHKYIRQMLSKFLWKGDSTKKGGAKISWINLTLPRSEGGIGLRDPEEWNKVQLLFQLCKVVRRAPSLWSDTICWDNLELKKVKTWHICDTIRHQATNSSDDEQLGFSFIIGDDTIRITEDDLIEHLQLPRDNFNAIPEDWELLTFFRGIRSTLTGNDDFPQHFNKSHLPKEWNLFFNILSHCLAPKTGGFHGLTNFNQIVGVAVANNLRINFGRLFMKHILENQSQHQNFILYTRKGNYPNINVAFLIEHMTDVFVTINAQYEDENDEGEPHADNAPQENIAHAPEENVNEEVDQPEPEHGDQAEDEVEPEQETKLENSPQPQPEAARQPPQAAESTHSNTSVYRPAFSGMGTSAMSNTYEACSDFISIDQLHLDPHHTKLLIEQVDKRGSEVGIPQIHNHPLEPNQTPSTLLVQTLEYKDPMHIEGETALDAANKEGTLREPTTLSPLKQRSKLPEINVNLQVSSQKDSLAKKIQGEAGDQMPNMTAPVLLPKILALDESSHDDRQLVSDKDRELRTPIAPLLTSLRMAPVSSAGTLGTRSFERSEHVRMSDTHNPKSSARVLSETPREACETPTIQTTPIDLLNYVTKSYLKEQLAFKDSYLKEQLALKDQHFQTKLSLRDHQIASLFDQLEHQQAAFASLREFVERSLSHTGKGKSIANIEPKLSVSKQALISVSSEAALSSTGPMTSVNKQLPVSLEIPNTGIYGEFGDEMEEELEERIDERIYAPRPLFSEDELEEGEIDESDVPMGCEPRFEEVATEERKIITEDEEFEDDDAFSDDCLFYGLLGKINRSYIEIQEEMERSRARIQRAIQRRENR